MSVLLRIFPLAITIALAGCAAPIVAMYALSAGATGWFGYKQYKLNSGATVEFRFELSDPPPSALEKIRHAKSLVLYPSLDGTDGDDIDLLRSATNMEIVSSSKTINWVEKNRAPKLRSLPVEERHNLV